MDDLYESLDVLVDECFEWLVDNSEHFFDESDFFEAENAVVELFDEGANWAVLIW